MLRLFSLLAVLLLASPAWAVQTVDGTAGATSHGATCSGASPTGWQGVLTTGTNEMIVVLSAVNAVNATGSAPDITALSYGIPGGGTLNMTKLGTATWHSSDTG